MSRDRKIEVKRELRAQRRDAFRWACETDDPDQRAKYLAEAEALGVAALSMRADGTGRQTLADEVNERADETYRLIMGDSVEVEAALLPEEDPNCIEFWTAGDFRLNSSREF